MASRYFPKFTRYLYTTWTFLKISLYIWGKLISTFCIPNCLIFNFRSFLWHSVHSWCHLNTCWISFPFWDMPPKPQNSDKTKYELFTYGLNIGHTTISLITFLANSSPAISSHDNWGPWSIIWKKQNAHNFSRR